MIPRVSLLTSAPIDSFTFPSIQTRNNTFAELASWAVEASLASAGVLLDTFPSILARHLTNSTFTAPALKLYPFTKLYKTLEIFPGIQLDSHKLRVRSRSHHSYIVGNIQVWSKEDPPNLACRCILLSCHIDPSFHIFFHRDVERGSKTSIPFWASVLEEFLLTSFSEKVFPIQCWKKLFLSGFQCTASVPKKLQYSNQPVEN